MRKDTKGVFWEEQHVSNVKRVGRMGQIIERRVTERLIDVQVQEQMYQIKESRYNKEYKRIVEPWLPQYLDKKWKKEEVK